jgi:hypothetical protein
VHPEFDAVGELILGGESGKVRLSRLGTRQSSKPVDDAQKIEGRRGEKMLKMGFDAAIRKPS